MVCAGFVLKSWRQKANCRELKKRLGSELVESMNYKVSDFISRIKNAALAHRKRVLIPYGKINKAIGKVLIKEGYLEDLKEDTFLGEKVLTVMLKYEKRLPFLTDIKVVSRPSLRIYTGVKGIPMIERKGRHTIIISTSQGIMAGREACKKGLGGEVLFEIW